MSRASAVYFAITDHGFGHASRSLAVIREVHRLAPKVRLLLNTGVPRWFVESILGDTPVEFVGVPLDCGIRQRDFLQMDLAGTLTQARGFYEEPAQSRLIERELAGLRAVGLHQNIRLVFGDIPPLAARLARELSVPCWMLGNFSWDFIYRYYESEVSGFAELADQCAALYTECERLFRPPFSEGSSMELAFACARIDEVGLTGPRPRVAPEEVLRRLGLAPDLAVVLLSFGGLGLADVPYERLARFDGTALPRRHFLTFDESAAQYELPNLSVVRDPALRQIDLLQVVERLVSKPGHGTFCEVARSERAFVCLDRPNFPETPRLRAVLADYFTHRLVALADFTGHRDVPVSEDSFADLICGPLSPPRVGLKDVNAGDASGRDESGDGNTEVARAIAGYVGA